MDPTLNQNVQNTGNEVAKLTESIPGLLSGLKTNLTSIFTKDNPMFAERENALKTFLNTPSATRAELLPANQPMVEGSPLNFSPTQQNAMVTARSNAALVPLAGLNQSIVGQYGNLADMLSSAGGIYEAQLGGANQRYNMAQQLYQNAVEEAKRAEQIRQFNIQEGRLGSSSGGLDLSALIAAMLGGQQQDSGTDEWEVVEAPQAPAAATDLTSQPLQTEQPSFWDNLLGFIGATPKEGQNQPTSLGQNLSGYNFSNAPIQLGIPQQKGLGV